MPKRSCPFAHNTKLLKMHIDMRDVGKEDYKKEVYEKTMNLMKKGAIEASRCKNTEVKTEKVLPRGKKILGPAYGKMAQLNKCVTCSASFINCNALSCEFCEKKICENCCRLCISCEKNFCHVCSVVNYDMRDERVFCLSCSGQ